MTQRGIVIHHFYLSELGIFHFKITFFVLVLLEDGLIVG